MSNTLSTAADQSSGGASAGQDSNDWQQGVWDQGPLLTPPTTHDSQPQPLRLPQAQLGHHLEVSHLEYKKIIEKLLYYFVLVNESVYS